jgi:cobalt-zinc-cadmium efflux system protein
MAGTSRETRRSGHDHGHGHAHAHAHGHDHDHLHGADANERRIFWVMWLTAGFTLVEAAGGLYAGSLALLADAGHMVTDSAALALAWYAFRVARRPADPRRSFGYHRIQVLAAFINGGVLVAVVLWIVVEAARRLVAPVEVLGSPMLAVGLAGLLVNIVAFALLRGGQENINVRGAALHVLGDLLGSGAAIVAAIVILATGWTPIDPILSVVVAVLVLRSAWSLLRRSGHILLEGTPDWLDVEALRMEVAAAVPGVEDVHHVHVWSMTTERPLLTMHARVAEAADRENILKSLQSYLVERYGIGHTTIQIEAACTDDGAARHP